MRYMGTNMNPSFTLNWCEGSRGQSTYVLKWSKNNAVDLRGVQEWKLFLDSFSVGSAERWRPAMASADRGNTHTHRCFAADNGRGADLVYLDWSRSSPFLNGCYQLLELLSCCHVFFLWGGGLLSSFMDCYNHGPRTSQLEKKIYLVLRQTELNSPCFSFNLSEVCSLKQGCLSETSAQRPDSICI